MTPFDAVALLAMLLAFYPSVSSAALARARRERPEYFAGGTLIGSKGDKLRLPDGRIFDLIQNAGGLPGQQRWQVIEPGPGAAEPWPLEPGPLTPIDVDAISPPRPGAETFESLVSRRLAELEGSDRVLETARSSLVESADRSERIIGRGTELDDAGGAVDEVARARSAETIADILGSSDGVAMSVTTTDNDYDQPPPQPALPHEPVLPGYPGEDGTGGEPGREDPRHPEHPERPGHNPQEGGGTDGSDGTV